MHDYARCWKQQPEVKLPDAKIKTEIVHTGLCHTMGKVIEK